MIEKRRSRILKLLVLGLLVGIAGCDDPGSGKVDNPDPPPSATDPTPGGGSTDASKSH
jgi:hypothetical protein